MSFFSYNDIFTVIISVLHKYTSWYYTNTPQTLKKLKHFKEKVILIQPNIKQMLNYFVS